MQNKTDKGTSLVSKSLPVTNLNSANRLLSTRKKKYYDSLRECLGVSGFHRHRLSLSGNYSYSDCKEQAVIRHA